MGVADTTATGILHATDLGDKPSLEILPFGNYDADRFTYESRSMRWDERSMHLL